MPIVGRSFSTPKTHWECWLLKHINSRNETSLANAEREENHVLSGWEAKDAQLLSRVFPLQSLSRLLSKGDLCFSEEVASLALSCRLCCWCSQSWRLCQAAPEDWLWGDDQTPVTDCSHSHCSHPSLQICSDRGLTSSYNVFCFCLFGFAYRLKWVAGVNLYSNSKPSWPCSTKKESVVFDLWCCHARPLSRDLGVAHVN